MSDKYLGPIFVNPKQFHRIMIRRQEKLDFNAKYGISNEHQKKPYFNESRHIMAKKRIREGGRFAKQPANAGTTAITSSQATANNGDKERTTDNLQDSQNGEEDDGPVSKKAKLSHSSGDGNSDSNENNSANHSPNNSNNENSSMDLNGENSNF